MAANKFGALKTYREQAEPLELAPSGRPKGKRSNPNFEATTLLLGKATKRAVYRALEDRNQQPDLSVLVERLLNEWMSMRA